jgi:hypothetical protein
MASGRSWRCRAGRAVTGLLALALCTVADTSPADAFPPPFYSAREIRATVVNEETGDPLPDVVVVALWELRQVSARPRLHITEAVTDAQGNFHIPAWGPKLRPPLAELAYRSPLLLLFKSGFTPLRLHNESRAKVEQFVPDYRTLPTKQLLDRISWYHGSPNDAVQDCIWDGLTLQMEPFRGTPEQWLHYLHGITDTVRYEEAQATITLHRRLLEEQFLYAREKHTSLGEKARGFFGSVKNRLRESAR